MRVSEQNEGLKVQAIAGTYVVILGIDLPEDACEGLLGFSIHRHDHTENEEYYLKGMKCFQATDPKLPSGSSYSTEHHPVQDFQWGDYSAKPGHTYTYTITAKNGTPGNMHPFATTSVTITTESPESDTHNVYFNRGISASQEYVRRFGDKAPGDVVPKEKAYAWLSRGIYEALEEYVNTCEPGVHSLRIAAYEFRYEPFLQLLKQRIDDGVDIQIIYDARSDQGPKEENRRLVEETGLGNYCTERTEGKSYISHNKFIVKLKNGEPVSVWTGGMNFSESGIFGHSNVAHVIKDVCVARKYLSYWQILKKDPASKDIKKSNEALSPTLIDEIPTGSTCIFSPRKNLDMLEFYKAEALKARAGFFMTFAFGINTLFKEVYKESECLLRFSLMEKKTRAFAKSQAEQQKQEEQDIQDIRNMPANIFAIGNLIRTNNLDGWVIEKLSGLSKNVKYIHNKFMLIDPLSDDPIVITGSANFSDASTTKNDENMVIIRGNTHVADIYLGEYMRLWKHHSFRESLTWKKKNTAPPSKYLNTDDWWSKYYEDTDNAARRKYFSNIH